MVARWQLLSLGLSSHQIQQRLRIGRLRRVHAGAYAVGHAPLTQRGHWMAAVLACGGEAVLSHGSAAALWRIGEARPRAEVTLHHENADGRRAKRPGITIHRSRWLPADHWVVRYAIPVTTPSRTLLDLAGTVSPTRLRRAFEAADRLELLDIAAVARICEAATGRKGVGRLRALVAEHRELPWTRSELERRFLRLIDRAGIPRPAVNVEVEGLEVDFFWPAQRLVVELDGWSFHRGRAAFERDRERSGVLEAAGNRVLRITDRRLDCSAPSVLRQLAALLGRSPP